MVPASGWFANREAMKIEEVCHVPFSDDVYNVYIYIHYMCIFVTMSPKNWWLEDEIVVLRCSLFRWHVNFRWRMSHDFSSGFDKWWPLTSSAGREDDISKEIEALLSRSGANLQKVRFVGRLQKQRVFKDCPWMFFFSQVCIRFGMWLQWHRVRCSFLRWVEIGKSKAILIAE